METTNTTCSPPGNDGADGVSLVVSDVPTGVSLVMLPALEGGPQESTGGVGADPPSHVSTAPEPHASTFRAENNIYTDDLTPEQIEALFAAQTTRPAPRVGSTSVMGQSDMDRLVSSLGGDAEATSSYAWLPTWAKDKPRTYPPASRRTAYSADDVYAEDTYADGDPSEEIRRIVIDLETTVATIDDTTVDTRDKVRDLSEDVRSLQIQTNDVEDGIGHLKAQNTAMTEEIKELRHAIVTMRNHVATLIRLLAVPAPGAPVVGLPAPQPGPGTPPAKGDETIA